MWCFINYYCFICFLLYNDILKEEGINAEVINARFLKPLDEETLIQQAKDVKLVVTIEEHAPRGGLGAAAAQVLSKSCPKRLLELNLPDEHLISGTNKEMFKYYGLDTEGIVASVRKNV